jgi:CHAT domain-containing protein
VLAAKQRWTLAPQGALISLPFAALVTATPPGGAAGDTDPAQLRATGWLGMERTLAIVPSVPSIVLQRGAPVQQAAAAGTPFFGLGDPAFRGVADPPLPGATNASRAARAAIATTRAPGPVRAYFRGGAANPAELARLSRLDGTASEVRALSEILGAGPGSIVLQMEATEAEVRRRNASGALGRAEVIAFATHGLVGGELADTPAEPALALTPPTGSGAPSGANDGLLTASEAATLDLSARLLILSACNTAAGGSADAESLSGLARAFFYAGARSMLVSHFPIFDAAAPFLTGDTVRLSKGQALDPPAAMREAMRRLVVNEEKDAAGLSFAHPKAWAAFAVVDAN